MYGTGTFEQLNKTRPGIYTKLTSSGGDTLSRPTYGGVALPCEVFYWPEKKEETGIVVARDTIPLVMEQYAFRNHYAFRQLLENILINAYRAYLYPTHYNTTDTLSGVAGFTPITPFGISPTGDVEVWFEVLDGEKTESTSNHINTKGITVTLSGDGTKGQLNFTIGDNKPQLIKPQTFDIGNALDGKIANVEIKVDENVAGQGVWWKENDYLRFKIRMKTAMNGDAIIHLGGGVDYETLATAELEKLEVEHSKMKNSLIAVECLVKNGLYEIDEKCRCAFLDYGLHLESNNKYFALVTLQNKTGKIELYESNESNIPLYVKTIDQISYEETDKFSEILSKFSTITVAKKDPETVTEYSWGQAIGNNTVYIEFVALYPPKQEENKVVEHFKTFMGHINGTPANIIYYPFMDEKYYPSKREEGTKLYQSLQDEYLNARGKGESTHQLLMDETTWDSCKDWNDNTAGLTKHDIFLISAAGDTRGGLDSICNTGYMAGMMTACDVSRSATGATYLGTRGLELYNQLIIEHMYDQGLMSYHEHYNRKMIYIDATTYRYETGDRKHSQEFERNKTIRAINKFKYEMSRIFFDHYFENNIYDAEDIEQSLKMDILSLINDMNAQGAFARPNSSDVAVSAVDSRSYSATVKLKMIGSAEILYITLGV